MMTEAGCRRRLQGLVGALLIVMLPGCEDAVSERATAEQLLKDNLYIEAAAMLEPLLEQSPDDQQLHLLAGLAAAGETLDQLNFLLTILAPILGDLDEIADVTEEDGNTKVSQHLKSVLDENQFFFDMIAGILRFLHEPAARAIDHLGQVTDPDLQLPLEDFQMRFFQNDFFELSGTWDMADAALLQFLIAPWAAVLDIVAAHEIELDIYLLIHRVIGNQPADTVPELGNVIVRLLESEDYPNFLKLKADTGAEDLAAAGVSLGAALARYAAFLDHAAQRQNGIGIVELEVEDESYLLRLVDWVRMDSDGRFDLNLINIDDASFQTFELTVPQSMVDAIAVIAANLSGTGADRPRFSIDEELLPILIPVGLGMLTYLETSELIQGVVDFIGRDPESATDFVASLVPEGLEIDLGAWFGSGKGVRHFVPVYRTDLEEGQNNFLLEWECPAFFTPSVSVPVGSTAVYPAALACPSEGDAGFESFAESDFDLVDGTHFASVTHATFGVDPIAADGLETSWPVVPFADPTLAGMLYIDASDLVEADPVPQAGAKPANNRSLNAWLAALYDALRTFF